MTRLVEYVMKVKMYFLIISTHEQIVVLLRQLEMECFGDRRHSDFISNASNPILVSAGITVAGFLCDAPGR